MNQTDDASACEPRDPRPSLWRHRDFLVYWFGQSVSRTGTRIAEFALPLTAILLFDASSSELGIINALAFAPYLALAIFAGVLIDRMKRRQMLILAESGRFLVFALAILLYFAGLLPLGVFYIVALLLGTCAVLFDISGAAYLPTLIDREQLVEGNAKLQSTIIVTQSAGPAIAGIMTQLFGSLVVFFTGILGPVVSLLTLGAIRHREADPQPLGTERSALHEIQESLKFIVDDSYLRFLTLRSGVNNLFFMMRNTILPLFVLQTLDLSAGTLGIILGAGAMGGFTGSLFARTLAEKLGPGRAITIGYAGSSVSQVVLPLAGGSSALASGMLISMFFVSGFFMTVGNTNVAALQQLLVPKRQLGRVLAGMRTVTWGSMPLGALLGGYLGSVIGLRGALAIGAAGFLLSALWIALSPVAKLRSFPDAPTET